jgi:hypothetical protein
MIANVFLASVTMVVCVTIQCLIVAVMLRSLMALDRRQLIRPTLVRVSSLLGGVLLIMLAGNLIQIGLWAWLFWLFGEFGDYGTAFYHSVVNFTTLGYGDLVMSEDGRLVGALEAANGVLMFGLTTAILFAVLDALIKRAMASRLRWTGSHKSFREPPPKGTES